MNNATLEQAALLMRSNRSTMNKQSSTSFLLHFFISFPLRMSLSHKNFGRRACFDARTAAPASHDGTGLFRSDFITQSTYTVAGEGFQKTFAYTSFAFSDSLFPSGPPAFGMALTIRSIRFVLEFTMNAAYTKGTVLQRVVTYIDETPEVGPENLNVYDLYAPLYSSPRYTIISDQLVPFSRPSSLQHECVYEFREDRDIRLLLSGDGPSYSQSKRIYTKIAGHSFSNCFVRPYTQLFVSATRPTDLYHPKEVEESETILLGSE